MPTYWFRPKNYGYGATPVTWQGWAVIATGVLAIAVAALLIRPWAWMAFFVVEAVILTVLWLIVRRKTDGEWRWRWGDR